MEKNLGIRVTFDGHSNTGRTILMEAFAAFLLEKGFTNVTVLHDGLRREGKEAVDMLEHVVKTQEGFTGKEIVMLERQASQHTLINGAQWQPMPFYIHPSHTTTMSTAQMVAEMGLNEILQATEPPVDYSGRPHL